MPTDTDHARLSEIHVELDQCWDLLRQRQVLRDVDKLTRLQQTYECLPPSLFSLGVVHLLVWSNRSLCNRSRFPDRILEGWDATFEMFESGGTLNARIVALSEPKTAEGKEKTDIYNPDPKKRTHPIIGLVFISGFTKKSDTRWENGTVYDPKSGKTYSCFMELQGPNKIKVRGFLVIPVMGRNYFWTRAD